MRGSGNVLHREELELTNVSVSAASSRDGHEHLGMVQSVCLLLENEISPVTMTTTEG